MRVENPTNILPLFNQKKTFTPSTKELFEIQHSGYLMHSSTLEIVIPDHCLEF